MNYQIETDVQNALHTQSDKHFIPTSIDLNTWFQATLQQQDRLLINKSCELTIRIVEADESQAINHDYRDKNKPTNVLSFPSDLPEFIIAEQNTYYLGDLIVCASVLETEANAQQKKIEAHWAHICIHGLLHLLGYDHIEDSDAQKMESLETQILAKLGIDDPYKDI